MKTEHPSFLSSNGSQVISLLASLFHSFFPFLCISRLERKGAPTWPLCLGLCCVFARTHTHTHTHAESVTSAELCTVTRSGLFMRLCELKCCVYKKPPCPTDYIEIHREREKGGRSPERSVRDFFKAVHSSFPLPRSQTSLCRSKNKIPPVKLSAPRFGALNAEANQGLGRDARPAHSGKVDPVSRANVGRLQPVQKKSTHTHTHNA